MRRLPLYLILLLVFACPEIAGADILYGRLLSVQSGDRLTVRVRNHTVRLHLAGIQAPKRGEFGRSGSRANLIHFCRSRQVLVFTDSGFSNPGIHEAGLSCKWTGGHGDMIYYQVDQGWARLRPETIDPGLIAAQNRAQAECRGMWRNLPGC